MNVTEVSVSLIILAISVLSGRHVLTAHSVTRSCSWTNLSGVGSVCLAAGPVDVDCVGSPGTYSCDADENWSASGCWTCVMPVRLHIVGEQMTAVIHVLTPMIIGLIRERLDVLPKIVESMVSLRNGNTIFVMDIGG